MNGHGWQCIYTNKGERCPQPGLWNGYCYAHDKRALLWPDREEEMGWPNGDYFVKCLIPGAIVASRLPGRLRTGRARRL